MSETYHDRDVLLLTTYYQLGGEECAVEHLGCMVEGVACVDREPT